MSKTSELTNEIEVTEEMVEAGKRVLWHYEQGFDTEATLVSCIFQSMAAVCPDLEGWRVVHGNGVIEIEVA